MDTTSVASAFASSQASQTQTLMAAKMLKMNAQADGAIAQMVADGQKNIQSLTNAGPGVGQNVNITA
jgi:hypothetical protein